MLGSPFFCEKFRLLFLQFVTHLILHTFQTNHLLNRLNGNIEYIDDQTTTYRTLTDRPNKSIKGGELAREILMTFEQTKVGIYGVVCD